MLYQAYQFSSDLTSPFRLWAQQTGSTLKVNNTEPSWIRQMSAAGEVMSRMRLTHKRPDYAITSVQTGEITVPVIEENTFTLPFGTLLHFKKQMPIGTPPQPALLLVAPLSGHFATLLRDTARTLLQDHDVYITDWHNARDVALSHGAFGLDDYTEYLIRFINRVSIDTPTTARQPVHVVAVCQPCVSALAAVAIMAEDDHPAQPATLTLMAGPVDCRINPTEVNKLATTQPIDWFRKNMISHVPMPHAGYMRKVYPGFVQLSAFMSMNMERHKKSFENMYEHLLNGEDEKARIIGDFYDEYLAVNDLPAEFYLETVEKVFQTFDLPRGVLSYRDRIVNPDAIKRTALFTVEGERDDICAIGQTLAAHDLCSNIRPYLKSHHVQAGVGHYGVFSGSKWKQQIYPRIRELTYSMTTV